MSTIERIINGINSCVNKIEYIMPFIFLLIKSLTYYMSCDVNLYFWINNYCILLWCQFTYNVISKYAIEHNHITDEDILSPHLRKIFSSVKIIMMINSVILLTSSTTCKETNSILYYFVLTYTIAYYIEIIFIMLMFCIVVIAFRNNQHVIPLQLSTISPDRIAQVGSYLISGNDNNEICPICINKFKQNDEIRNLPCEHKFHIQCIDQWIVDHNTCPLCRRICVHDDNDIDVEIGVDPGIHIV